MMGLSNASLWRRSIVTLAACLALVAPMTAQAGLLNGLSIRGGFWRSDSNFLRENVGDVVWGVGLDYQIAHFPTLLNGDQWSTSLSVDYHYASKKYNGVTRIIPVSINQVYTFDQEGSVSPYAGFYVSAVTINGTNQSTVTRLGEGLIGGLNIGRSVYIEGRYGWIDDHGLDAHLAGFTGYVGYRF
jgi:hypothetical protein